MLGVGYDASGDAAVVVLREVGGDRALPVWVSGREGRLIEDVLGRRRSPRPLAHEVLADVVHGFGRHLVDGTVDGTVDGPDAGAFHAELRFDDGTRVGARPADMVRVVLAVGATIRVARAVLDRAAIPLELDVGASPSPGEIDARAAAFRRWLEGVRVEDFGP